MKNDHIILENKAVELINLGKVKEAEELYRKLINAGSKNHVVYGNLAALCALSGKQKEMIYLLRIALKINPSYSDAHTNLGMAFKDQGDFKAAAQSFRQAIKFNQSNSNAYFNLGTLLDEQGDTKEAIQLYRKSIQVNPRNASPYNNLGSIFKNQGNLEDAVTYFQKAININSSFGKAYYNLGTTYNCQEKYDEAINIFKKSINLNPNFYQTYNNLGIAFLSSGNLEAAIDAFKKALKLNEAFLDALNNIGTAYQQIGDLENAICSFQQAIKLDANYASPHWNLSLTELLNGNYSKGWIEYEWRWKTIDSSPPHAQPQIPKWTGQVKNKDEKLLVVSEQGLGDTIQFMRYIPYIRSKGIEVSFCAQEKLHDLIRISGIDPNPLTKDQANEIKEGQWIPLLSLPGYLGVTPKNPIVTKPYVRSSNDLILKWKSILSKEKRPIIGINWQGNQKVEKVHHKGRSLALEQFSCIGNNTKMNFLSLQKGFGSEQLDKCSFRNNFVNCQKQIDSVLNFAEIAAIMINCDLIITSDTVVCHLAGGLNKKTYLLLKEVPEWRWGMRNSSTFWYPSMKLFRQKGRDNWNELMERVDQEIKKEFINL